MTNPSEPVENSKIIIAVLWTTTQLRVTCLFLKVTRNCGWGTKSGSFGPSNQCKYFFDWEKTCIVTSIQITKSLVDRVELLMKSQRDGKDVNQKIHGQKK